MAIGLLSACSTNALAVLIDSLKRNGIPLKELDFIAYFGPRSLSRIGLGGPEHPEDRNTEPIFGERGEIAEKPPGGCR